MTIIDDVSPPRKFTRERGDKLLAWYEEIRKTRPVHVFETDFGTRDWLTPFLGKSDGNSA